MRIGIVGAGMIGSTLAKLWADAGHEVLIASRHPEDLQPLINRLGKRTSAGTPAEAAAFGEVVMLTVPLAAIPGLARDLSSSLKGKIVLDTGNAYERRDGDAARQARLHPEGSAGWAAAMYYGGSFKGIRSRKPRKPEARICGHEPIRREEGTSGFWLLAPGFRLPASGSRLPASGFWLLAPGFLPGLPYLSARLSGAPVCE